APVHLRPLALLPADARRPLLDGGHSRIPAQPAGAPVGMLLPSALRLGHAHLPPEDARAPGPERVGAGGRLLAPQRGGRRARGTGEGGAVRAAAATARPVVPAQVPVLEARELTRYFWLRQGRGLLPRRSPVHAVRSEEHTSELQSLRHLVCRLLLE